MPNLSSRLTGIPIDTRSGAESELLVVRDGVLVTEQVTRLLSTHKTVTVSVAPNASYPDVPINVNDSDVAYQIFVDGNWPDNEELTPNNGYLGWLAGTDFTAGSGFWVKVDLGAEFTVTEVIARGLSDTGPAIYLPFDFNVEHSTDDSSYSAFGSAVDSNSTTGLFLWRLEASGSETARYLRFNFDHATSVRWIHLAQMEVFGS